MAKVIYCFPKQPCAKKKRMTKRENKDQARKKGRWLSKEKKKKGQIPRDDFQQHVAFVQKKIATLFNILYKQM